MEVRRSIVQLINLIREAGGEKNKAIKKEVFRK
jgi:hypothetical protein